MVVQVWRGLHHRNPNTWIVLGALLAVSPSSRLWQRQPIGLGPDTGCGGGGTTTGGDPTDPGPAARVVTVLIPVAVGTQRGADRTVSESEVLLKSLLHNPPPAGYGLQVYLVVNGHTKRGVLDYLKNVNNATTTSVPTRITVLDATNAEKPAAQMLEAHFGQPGRPGQPTHSPGPGPGPAVSVWEFGFLLAPWLLPPGTDRVIYAETDSWFLASPVGLWNHRRPGSGDGGNGVGGGGTAAVEWGRAKSTGMMLLGLPQVRAGLWRGAAAAWCAAVGSGAVEGPDGGGGPGGGGGGGGGASVSRAQIVLRALDRAHPALFTALPAAYDVNLAAERAWEAGTSAAAVAEIHPQAAAFHSAGGGALHPDGTDPVHWRKPFAANSSCWGLVVYYVDLPWSWLRNSLRIRAKSQAGSPAGGSHTIEVVVTALPADFGFDGLAASDPPGCPDASKR